MAHFVFADREEDRMESTSKIQRRLLRCGSSPLDLSEREFGMLFRLSKEAFVYVMEQTKSEFKSRNSSGAPVILRIAATLRFLSEGSYQRGVVQDYLIGMAQPTVSNIMSETLEILERKLCAKHIRFTMTSADKDAAKAHFFDKGGFPNIIMCVDGTHISIIRPPKNEHHFFNRKGYHSINAMMVCDHKTKITCVNACYGGSSHDSVVWSMSDVRHIMEESFKSGDTSLILGDAGYTLEPWLMTPFRSASVNSPEAKYNEIHSKSRCTIERCFGVLKGRFRCLLHSRELHYKPEKAARIINVCAMLHNVCLKFNVDFCEDLFEVSEPEIEPDLSDDSTSNYANVARRIRNEIRDSF